MWERRIYTLIIRTASANQEIVYSPVWNIISAEKYIRLTDSAFGSWLHSSIQKDWNLDRLRNLLWTSIKFTLINGAAPESLSA